MEDIQEKSGSQWTPSWLFKVNLSFIAFNQTHQWNPSQTSYNKEESGNLTNENQFLFGGFRNIFPVNIEGDERRAGVENR